ncbi:MAG: DUF1905 domain-containing protein [Halobacteriovoraceae bacterium]|nr:DUF1905 domain-containing protein [Halobacteriovoraceae bacterium]MCB9095346.1 DUF1905 domain-containing protein [Halobacteriovoraceae bacterium]
MSKTNTSEFIFQGKVWIYKQTGGWHFVTLPKQLSKKIRKQFFESEEGWGRLKTTAFLGHTTWETSIWFDSKIGSYIIPLKASVRKQENINEESQVKIKIEFDLNNSI